MALFILWTAGIWKAFAFLVGYKIYTLPETKCAISSSGGVRLYRGVRVEFVLGVVFDCDRQSPMPQHSSELCANTNHALFNNRNSQQVSSASGNAATRQTWSFCVCKESAGASERILAVFANWGSVQRQGNSKTRGHRGKTGTGEEWKRSSFNLQVELLAKRIKDDSAQIQEYSWTTEDSWRRAWYFRTFPSRVFSNSIAKTCSSTSLWVFFDVFKQFYNKADSKWLCSLEFPKWNEKKLLVQKPPYEQQLHLCGAIADHQSNAREIPRTIQIWSFVTACESWKVQPKFFNFLVCNICQSSPS